ncbi:MAG: phytanoyl-CoA dioxygenase [Propionibacteriales bacterium]|nr:phytanoyl-CoA dioxygenase [Propionibacteriales bacterium]
MSRLAEDDCHLDDLREVVDEVTDVADYPLATSVEQNVLMYDSDRLRSESVSTRGQAELARALMDGPGIVVLRGAFADPGVVDRATDAFNAMISTQHASGESAGDHFAKPGANDRVWNALEKLALREPEAFAAYYANDMLALVSLAWLGPGYQVTSQVNVVNPGGVAQTVHRDYHLGFMANERVEQYPTHVHRLSPVLTLQGAVAHGDMPVETGPTKYLPHSHKYLPGYLAWRRAEFGDHFESNYVQLPLAKGDAVFFNPALFHAAGHNRSADVRRMANLLQISSAFGRAMESVDRESMCNALFPTLLEMRTAGTADDALRNVVAASAEGYAFPTNLDRDQPVDGPAPTSQAALVWQAVEEGWDPSVLRSALTAYSDRRRTH